MHTNESLQILIKTWEIAERLILYKIGWCPNMVSIIGIYISELDLE